MDREEKITILKNAKQKVLNSLTTPRNSKATYKGSCLCKAVQFQVQGRLVPPDACHCTNCRKQSGHFFVSTDILRSALSTQGTDTITWYQSSEKVKRGFCSICGSLLFWDAIDSDHMGIAMGAFDLPTHTKIVAHIFTDYQGDYYEINDDIPKIPD